MRKLVIFLVLPALLLLHAGCAAIQQNRWLAAHRAELERLASSNLTPEQKIDGLVSNYVEFMDQGLRFSNPVKGIKYVQKYHDQNAASIEKILSDAENFQEKMSITDRLSLAGRLIKKPYWKDVATMAPKFKRKYKQYEFAVRLTSRVTGGLGKLAGKIL